MASVDGTIRCRWDHHLHHHLQLVLQVAMTDQGKASLMLGDRGSEC